jgi:hypothetical protein
MTSSVKFLQIAAQFVEAVADFRAVYQDRVRLVFCGNPKFYASIDKVRKLLFRASSAVTTFVV